MATNYTTLLGLAQPTTGELAGTWGDTVNNYITTYLDAAVAGAQVLSTDADVTLTKTTGAALTSTSSQYAILNCTGARTAARNITAPAAYKTYVVINATTGGFAVTIRGAGPTTGVSIANGEEALVAWNGSDFVVIATNNMASGGLIGTLSVARGGTGAATLTANNVLLGNGTSAVQVVAPSTSGNLLTSNGTTWASTAPAGSGFMASYTSSGSFTYPAGVTSVKVTVVGGGGGGGGVNSTTATSGGGGGVGAVAVGAVANAPGTVITVTVGAAGSGGSSGGTSSFGSAISCTGGSPGTLNSVIRGANGAASGGSVSFSYTETGDGANNGSSGAGGPYGRGGDLKTSNGAGNTGVGYGAGGGGAQCGTSCSGSVFAGGAGRGGLVIVEW